MSKKPVQGINQERGISASEASHKAGPKIGEGHASAMLRQGLKELRGALYPDSNVVQPTEYGVYGTKTQGEIADERSGIDRKSTLDAHVERAGSRSKQQERSQEKQPERARDEPELEME